MLMLLSFGDLKIFGVVGIGWWLARPLYNPPHLTRYPLPFNIVEGTSSGERNI